MQILFAESLKFYIASMQKSINDVKFYLKPNELIMLHNEIKKGAIEQVRLVVNFGSVDD